MNAVATAAASKMQKMVSGLSTKQICEAYELTNSDNSEHIPTVRGALMAELELRDAVAFDAWMMTDVVAEMDKPSLFFC
jgi:hypothetical protein